MLIIKDFSLRHTIESGQPLAFYSDYTRQHGKEELRYVTQKGIIWFRLSGERADYTFEGEYTKSSAGEEIRRRFSIDEDIMHIYKSISTDEFMAKAIKEFHGLRITCNDPWETALCFVVSQFNNIKRIRGIMRNLINEFGPVYDGIHLFPGPEQIADSSTARIRACGTGFRDRYIKRLAEEFSSGFDAKRLYRMKYDDAKAKLMALDGIGDKVADCILLFGYNKLEAFPIDVWVKRVMEKAYFNGRKTSMRQIHDFSAERWGKYRGYAQQYIFWYGREKRMI
jgi:N-glycosylase/DNA lyase